jgi:NTE family protein
MLKKIGLSLSGGGFRAAVFHLGALKYLAEKNRLEEVVHISTVSGGSIAMGLVYKLAGNKFPTSEEYLQIVFPKIEQYFVEENFGIECLRELAKPVQWRNLVDRANILADVLFKKWGITISLNNLPKHPIWEICSTTNETGKSWRFTQGKMGDYKFGYSSNDFLLSRAIAASAAFPGLIGRFRLNASNYQWFTYSNWKLETTKSINPKFPILHLSDGGVYDNLATEPFFKTLGVELSDTIDYLIVCDASKDLEEKKSVHFLRMISRSIRLINIAIDQIRMLRTRAIHNFLGEFSGEEGKGLFIKSGQYFRERNELQAKRLEQVKRIKTSIFKLKKNDFDMLIEEAYFTAEKTYTKYG